MIKEAIIKLSQKEDLTYQEAESNTGSDVFLSHGTFHEGRND